MLRYALPRFGGCWSCEAFRYEMLPECIYGLCFECKQYEKVNQKLRKPNGSLGQTTKLCGWVAVCSFQHQSFQSLVPMPVNNFCQHVLKGNSDFASALWTMTSRTHVEICLAQRVLPCWNWNLALDFCILLYDRLSLRVNNCVQVACFEVPLLPSEIDAVQQVEGAALGLKRRA